MRTILCRQCLTFITVDSTLTRDVLATARTHVLNQPDLHRSREVTFVDVDSSSRRLLTEALGAKT